MAVPKKRTSRRRRDMRRAHDALKVTAAVESCPACGELKLRHRACDACGTYRTHNVLPTSTAE
ncbi:MAG: 50S ribosomal protein L32 [Myxococcota bacterium]